MNEPKTYIPTHDLLTRAMSLLGITDSATVENCAPPEHANYVRCLAGAFHNIAGSLYQAGRYGSAISFLKDGCQLGSVAVKMHRAADSSSDSDSKVDAWKQLDEQLYRRWQLLGACYTKIGDRQVASYPLDMLFSSALISVALFHRLPSTLFYSALKHSRMRRPGVAH